MNRIVIPAIVIETGQKSRLGENHGKLSYGMEHQEMCDLNSIRCFMTRDLLEVMKLNEIDRREKMEREAVINFEEAGDKKRKVRRGATRKALCYMIVFQV